MAAKPEPELWAQMALLGELYSTLKGKKEN